MDLSSPNLLLVKPIAKDLPRVPSTNKEARKLKFVPPLTIEHKAITYLLKRSNGQVTKPPRIMEDPTIENSPCYPKTLFLTAQSQKAQHQQNRCATP